MNTLMRITLMRITLMRITHYYRMFYPRTQSPDISWCLVTAHGVFFIFNREKILYMKF